MGMRRKVGSTKSPSVFSHEFVIQNHADIVSCVAMFMVVGLMFQVTQQTASLFITMQHNHTEVFNDTEPPTEVTYYTNGRKDFCSVFFYLLIAIVLHAVVQEYILDKVNRRLHLSKVKHSKFNESGQLVIFYVASVIWGANIIFEENYITNIAQLWEGYPHTDMLFQTKFFYICQLAYWVHCFPELYFQKVKKDEMPARVQYASLYLVFIGATYALNLTRVGLCCMVIHYFMEALFHVSRMLYYSEKMDFAKTGFSIWAVLFVIARFLTVTLAVLTFWFGLGRAENQTFDLATGNFNTFLIRINCLAAISLLQVWMMWNFLNFQLRRYREATAAKQKAKQRQKERREAKLQAAKKRGSEASSDEGGDTDVSLTPRANKAENGGPRTRNRGGKKH
ncbi:translocating chain-associated membrane protein 1-like isoform X1 [Branchiostoma floridae]|uniref:Translocating chain-associated membrane protein 1-like isoform X1 n=1 Tax=Branchiostoma floridae TaxID=7739 RepID=A0A9J7HIK3_BRAFL|nr:translocating chain-associated membrane protein 1-like isoform X1 [Branchiostoma floridae]